VTQPVLDGYRLFVAGGGNGRGRPITAASVASYLAVVVRLGLAAEFLTHDRLLIVPWAGRTPYVVAGVTEQTENATPRIPEPVIESILRWSLFYVQVAAPDVLAARDEAALRPRHVVGNGAPEEDLTAFIERRRRQRRGLPGQEPQSGRWVRGRTEPEVNRSLIAAMVGRRVGMFKSPRCTSNIDAAREQRVRAAGRRDALFDQLARELGDGPVVDHARLRAMLQTPPATCTPERSTTASTTPTMPSATNARPAPTPHGHSHWPASRPCAATPSSPKRIFPVGKKPSNEPKCTCAAKS
jgi:hypothetical protein